MVVRHAMTRGAETIGPGETLQAAARAMRAAGVGLLVVVERGRTVGLITDRDLVTRAVAEGRDPGWTPVHAAMTPQVITCGEDDDLGTAARVMEDHAVRRLVVLDAEGALAGVLSVDDLAEVDRALAARVLERAGAPERFAPEVWIPAWDGEEAWP
jgi:CBS domain-containing protein